MTDATATGKRQFRPLVIASFRSPAIAALVLGILLVVGTAAVWLSRPGGLTQGAVTQSVRITGISGGLLPGRSVVQEVSATENGLAGISAVFGTYKGATDCAIDVAVTAPDDRVLSHDTIACSKLVDTAQASVIARFPAIPDSRGKTYTVTIKPAPGNWSQAVTLWTGKPGGAALDAIINGHREDVTTAIVAEYDSGSTASQFSLALERIALGAPWWSQPAAMVAWTVLLVAALVGALVSAGTRLRVATILVVAVALFRGLIWSSIIPPTEGMDEPAHIAYAQFMAEEGRIPVRGVPFGGVSDPLSPQLIDLELYQRIMDMGPGDRADHTPQAIAGLESDLLHASPLSNGMGPAAGYPPVYYAPAALLYEATPGPLNLKTYSMRLWSVMLGALAAWGGVLAGRRLFPRRDHTAVLFGLAVALQPMISHQFAIVNNDALAIAAGIGALVMSLKLADGHARARDLVLGGALVGAALLAKPFGAGALPVVALGWLIGWYRAGKGWRSLVRGPVGIGAGLAATYGLWLLAQLALSIPSTGLPVYADGDPSRGPRHYLALQFASGLDSFRLKWDQQLFGSFAWLDVYLPAKTYDLIWYGLEATVVLGGVWLVVVVSRRLRSLNRSRTTPVVGDANPVEEVHDDGFSERTNSVRTSLAITNLLGVLALLYLAGYLYFRSAGRDELLQGRYALMALPALLALPALFLEGVLRGRRGSWRRFVTPGVTGIIFVAMWTLQVVSVATLAERFYL
jgi:4-amino-4-deoxy-L-arabinose transferase-like glycosyltransferase